MAIKGLSNITFGDYANDAGNVTYSNPVTGPHAIEYSIEIEKTDDNPLYGDNIIIENDKGKFKNGTLTLKTDKLPQAISKRILGIKEIEVKYGPSDGQKTTKTLVFDDDAKPPFLGVGLIELHQENDIDVYRAVFINKVYFNVPNEAAKTKGETIEWQTKEISGVIQRSDAKTDELKHPWKYEATFATEEEAAEYLKFLCGKTYE